LEALEIDLLEQALLLVHGITLKNAMQKKSPKINALIASLINCTKNLFSESTAQTAVAIGRG
jgi:hypothetical protein